MEKDVFICHTSQDKTSVVSPLVNAFSKEGISFWVDQGEIGWGDSITRKVNEGLSKSQYVIVVLSTTFLGKNWPEREFFAILNQEASSGEVRLLPLLVGSKNERDNILQHYPLINDKLFLVWEGKTDPIVVALCDKLGRRHNEPKSSTVSSPFSEETSFIAPIPRIKKTFTQKQKDDFLQTSFKVIGQYFQSALHQLKSHYSEEIDVDFVEIHKSEFLAKIYANGNIKNQCKIWLGGLSSTDSIAYYEGKMINNAGNAFNESITIVEDGDQLKLRLLMSLFWEGGDKENFSAEEVAEALWRRFTKPLEW